jgi:drug/metabolite transporter, DME family
MATSLSNNRRIPWGLSPAAAGTVLCALSALSYTAANVCMRRLSTLGCDPMWATCCRESVATIVLFAWIGLVACRGRKIVLSWQTFIRLVLVGLAVQWCGNVAVQWAFDRLGIAITIPTIFGSMLVATAMFGWWMLGERLAARSWAAVLLSMFSIWLLSRGAVSQQPLRHDTRDRQTHASSGQQANRPTLRAADPSASREADALGRASGTVWLPLAAALTAGVVFGLLAIAIRHSVTGSTRCSTVGVIITGAGMFTFGPACVARLGMTPLLGTLPAMYGWMLAAGLLNLAGFMLISRALEITTAVHANMINSSQVAMAAMAGMLLFGERLSLWLISGVCLTVASVILIEKPGDGNAEPIVDV